MSTHPPAGPVTGSPPSRLAYFLADLFLDAFAELFKAIPRTRKT